MPKELEALLRQTEECAATTLERVRITQSSLATVSEHQKRMLEAIDKSRALIAGLSPGPWD